MNNLRFDFSGKRKFRTQITLDASTAAITLADVKKNVASGTGSLRITRVEFELLTKDSNATFFQLAVLERPAIVTATNSVGVDGAYKVPDDHVLRTWYPISSTVIDNIQIAGANISAQGDEISVYVYGEFVQ